MPKVGILGGTFDPPHLGHLLIAHEVLDTLGLDEIWFMPNGTPPHKPLNSNTSAKHRLAMLEEATASEPRFRVEPIELERNGPSYTFDTIQQLLARERGTQFSFIIGADMVEYLPNWYRIDELLELITFIGVQRPTYQLASPYPITFVDIPEFGVSSSLVRDRLKIGRTIKYLVPDSVIHYIKEHHLYGT